MSDAIDSQAEAGAASEAPPGQPTQRLAGIGPGHILFFALVVGLFSVAWFVSYQFLDQLIWDNSFVAANRWTIPVGVMFFSLLVGLAQKYLHAPNSIRGGAMEPLLAGDTTGYKTFWGTLATSFVSLFSGASVGPEGPIGFLAIAVSEWLASRLKLAKEAYLPASMAGLSAAYNGLVGNSIFAALFASETGGGRGGLALLVANLAAGSVGFLIYALLGVPPFAGFLQEGQPFDLTLELVIWAIALGLLGSILALYTGIALRVFGRLMSVFEGRPIPRVMIAGAIVAVVCYFVPNLMFSGEAQIDSLMANPAQVGVATLLFMALMKPLLLALSLKSGYMGGPIFPSLFAAVMVGLALSLLFPQVPVNVLTACIQVGVVALVLNAPLTSILLVSVVTAADADLVELIVVAAVTAVIAGQVFKRLAARRGGGAEQGDPAADSNSA